MNFFYFDASALAKRFVPEKGTDILNHLMNNVPLKRLMVYDLGLAEIVSIFVRKRNDGRISPAVFSQAMINFGAEIIESKDIRKISSDTLTVLAAIPSINIYALNATDAVILRTVIDIANDLRAVGNDLVLVASDIRLVNAAKSENIISLDPEQQDIPYVDSLI